MNEVGSMPDRPSRPELIIPSLRCEVVRQQCRLLLMGLVASEAGELLVNALDEMMRRSRESPWWESYINPECLILLCRSCHNKTHSNGGVAQ